MKKFISLIHAFFDNLKHQIRFDWRSFFYTVYNSDFESVPLVTQLFESYLFKAIPLLDCVNIQVSRFIPTFIF